MLQFAPCLDDFLFWRFHAGRGAGATAQNVRTLRLTTPDNVGISAAYYSVTNDPAPAVLLVHGFTTNRDDWGTFPMLLQLNGIAALTFDLRGHGESNRKMTAQARWWSITILSLRKIARTCFGHQYRQRLADGTTRDRQETDGRSSRSSFRGRTGPGPSEASCASCTACACPHNHR